MRGRGQCCWITDQGVLWGRGVQWKGGGGYMEGGYMAWACTFGVQETMFMVVR